MKQNGNKNVSMIVFIIIFSIPFLILGSTIPIEFAILMEAFVSIHMSVFVLKPLSNKIGKNFWHLFIIRVLILLFVDFFITPAICIVDFCGVFVGAILLNEDKLKGAAKMINNNSSNSNISNTTRKCEYCENEISVNALKCPFCNAPLQASNSKASNSNNLLMNIDSIYNYDESTLVEEFIKREMTKASLDLNTKLIPMKAKKRKIIFNLLFAILLFVSIASIFFHFPIATYAIEIIILIIFFATTRKYDLIKYLRKQLELRPKEKISNIVMSVKNELVQDNSKNILIVGSVLAIVLPLFLFYNPRILYEKVDNGYAVRYYLFGLTNFETVEIPSEYNGEKVVSIRGNGFSNMFFLKKATLPDTITELRGQAFKNDVMLTEVKLPDELEYLGGGAFANCKSLVSIDLPSTLTYIGGESFLNATKLKNIVLPEKITEIHGNTFENCTSLESINIPDNVTRIGGHAFYGCSSLKDVKTTKNSKLNEIGSSAFRNCYNLNKIIIPITTHVNERAFKDSPTNIDYYSSNSDYNHTTEISLSADHNYAWIHSDNYEEDITIEHYSYTSENGNQEYRIIVFGPIDDEIIFNSENSYKKVNDDLELTLKTKNNGYTTYEYLEVNYN